MSGGSSDQKRRRAPDDSGPVLELGQMAKKAKKAKEKATLQKNLGRGIGFSNKTFNPNLIISTNEGGSSNSSSSSKSNNNNNNTSKINKLKSKINSSNSSGSNTNSRYEKLRAKETSDDEDSDKDYDESDEDDQQDKEEEEGGSSSSLNLVEKFSRLKKKFLKKKADKYTVEPRFGGWEDSVGIDERRGINYQIQKNKGLTPHRKKENRNARVKKRHQYDNALMRRKGQVQEVKVGIGSYYPGEINGIKSDVSKSRKFKN